MQMKGFMKMKKIIFSCLWGLCTILSLLSTITVFASETIYVTLDGNTIDFDVKPQVINDRTMVPIRAIFEKMGATVEWDESTNSAVCQKGNTVVKMTVGSMDMYINNQISKMDVSPVVVDGRTLAPARYVAEAFGADVQWDPTNNTVVICSKDVYLPIKETAEIVEHTVTLYALDGRTAEVLDSEVPAYLTVGWYRTLAETKQTMYAPDGRTLTVFKSEAAAYKNVGWYETQAQAQAVSKIANRSFDTNNPTADGYYYRTPTGKRYHLDPNCGGKNSYRTTNISDLSPCSKCAK